MFHVHAGWFRDRPIFEALYIGMVKKSVEQTLSDFEYAELARLYMRYLIFFKWNTSCCNITELQAMYLSDSGVVMVCRYQHVLTAEPLCEFIEYFLLQRGITLEVCL